MKKDTTWTLKKNIVLLVKKKKKEEKELISREMSSKLEEEN